MDRIKGLLPHLGFVAVMAGALLSRDACFGGARPPPPEPAQAKSAEASPSGAPSSAPPPTAAPSSTFAAPP